MDKWKAADVTPDASPVGNAAASTPLSEAWREAQALHRTGHAERAQRGYEEVLASEPDHPGALHGLGLLQAQAQHWQRAVELMTRAIALAPDAVLHNNLGNVRVALKEWDAAIANFDLALALTPDAPEIYNNRGNALRGARRFEAAVADYQKAIECKPDFAQAYNNLGVALSELRRFPQALGCYDKAIELAPDQVESHHNRGHALTELQQLAAAINSYDRALALAPDYPYLEGLRLDAKMHICDWRNLDSELAQLEAKIERGEKVCPPFALLALSGSLPLQRKCAEIWAHAFDDVKDVLGPLARRSRPGRIRIGYFSSDFQQHATAYLIAGLLEQHDRSQFEVMAFSFGPRSTDDMRQRLQAGCDQFLEVGHLSDVAIAGLSRHWEIDIAVDLKGFTQGSRPGIFAARAAAVQVSYLGYPATMAADFIDYLIADNTVIPREQRAQYAQKIVTMAGSYQVNDEQRRIAETVFTRAEWGLPERGFVFCCFNNNYKIPPAIFALWMRLLKQVDGSVLWLLQDSADAAENLRGEAVARGVDARRLVFARRLPQAEHLARHRLADLFLDTFPCNAHTTASDALWAGLPLLSCSTQAFAGRVAASLLKAVDLPELICSSAQTYEAIALRLARDPAQLRSMRQRLVQDRSTAPLFNTALFTRRIEAAYVQMLQRQHDGLGPDHILVANA